MLEKQARELLVKAYEKSHNASEVARNFSVNKHKNNISLEVKTNLRGRK